MSSADIIDRLAGIGPDSGLRDLRPQARENAEASYRALFEPAHPGGFPMQDRFVLAVFVTGLHADAASRAFYEEGLDRLGPPPGLAEALRTEIARAAAAGPYGRFPEGPLSHEDEAGPVYTVSEAGGAVLGERLAAGLAHAHLLVFHPRDASPAALERLLAAGWTTAAIVTLSQLVAFLSFQIRVAAGLRVLASCPAAQEAAR